MIKKAEPNISILRPSWNAEFLGTLKLLALWFSLAFPSVALFKKVGGGGAFAYLVLSFVGVFGALVLLRIAQERQLILWMLRGIASLSTLAVVIGFFLFHPIVDYDGFNVGGVQIGASDTDNAVDVGLGALLDGKYPYYETTFLGNPLTPLPGTFILALPFYLLGNSSVQNLFWIGVFIFVFSRRVEGKGVVSVLLLLLIFGAPCVVYRVITGGDYFTNNIIVLMAMLGLLLLRPRTVWIYIVALFAGFAVATRPNFLFLLPMLFLFVVRKWSFKHAVLVHTFLGLVFLILILPFFVHDPTNFSPLHISDKVEFGDYRMVPKIVIPLFGGLLSLAFGIWGNTKAHCAMQYSFWIQCGMVILVMFFAWLYSGEIRWGIEPNYGVLFLFFGIFGFGIPVFWRVVMMKEQVQKNSLSVSHEI
jgi:hypothetical protein